MGVVSSFEVRRGSIDPGGYTLKGGVYNFQRPLDYMQDATSAGHFAWQKELSEEFERTGLLAEKEAGKRETGDYVPTFFTTQANHDKLTASIGGPAGQHRPSRNAQFAK